MDPLADSSRIFKYHREMMDQHGPTSSYALGWRDEESQQVRFKALAGIADLNSRSVLDAGCGYGDLLPFLLQLYPGLASYCGIEQIPELIDIAAQRHSGSRIAHFISGNFMTRQLPAADYVFASGSLNYKSDDPRFIYIAIARLFAACKMGLGFNLLRDVPDGDLLAAYDSEEIVAYCNSLSENVVLVDDYAEEDLTVWMYR